MAGLGVGSRQLIYRYVNLKVLNFRDAGSCGFGMISNSCFLFKMDSLTNEKIMKMFRNVYSIILLS